MSLRSPAGRNPVARGGSRGFAADGLPAKRGRPEPPGTAATGSPAAAGRAAAFARQRPKSCSRLGRACVYDPGLVRYLTPVERQRLGLRAATGGASAPGFGSFSFGPDAPPARTDGAELRWQLEAEKRRANEAWLERDALFRRLEEAQRQLNAAALAREGEWARGVFASVAGCLRLDYPNLRLDSLFQRLAPGVGRGLPRPVFERLVLRYRPELAQPELTRLFAVACPSGSAGLCLADFTHCFGPKTKEEASDEHVLEALMSQPQGGVGDDEALLGIMGRKLVNPDDAAVHGIMTAKPEVCVEAAFAHGGDGGARSVDDSVLDSLMGVAPPAASARSADDVRLERMLTPRPAIGVATLDAVLFGNPPPSNDPFCLTLGKPAVDEAAFGAVLSGKPVPSAGEAALDAVLLGKPAPSADDAALGTMFSGTPAASADEAALGSVLAGAGAARAGPEAATLASLLSPPAPPQAAGMPRGGTQANDADSGALAALVGAACTAPAPASQPSEADASAMAGLFAAPAAAEAPPPTTLFAPAPAASPPSAASPADSSALAGFLGPPAPPPAPPAPPPAPPLAAADLASEVSADMFRSAGRKKEAKATPLAPPPPPAPPPEPVAPVVGASAMGGAATPTPAAAGVCLAGLLGGGNAAAAQGPPLDDFFAAAPLAAAGGATLAPPSPSAKAALAGLFA